MSLGIGNERGGHGGREMERSKAVERGGDDDGGRRS